MAEPKQASGTVKWFSALKGFGFIAPDGSGNDLFVHQTSIHSDGFRTLFEGQLVEFSIEFVEDMRTKAADVTVLDGSCHGGCGGWRGWYGDGEVWWHLRTKHLRNLNMRIPPVQKFSSKI